MGVGSEESSDEPEGAMVVVVVVLMVLCAETMVPLLLLRFPSPMVIRRLPRYATHSYVAAAGR
jgi:hypothetical protein